jgi:hypothetical protein
MNGITENISIKPKRGRPYLFFTDANDKRECKKHYPDVRTDRTLVNRLYSDRALSVLGDGHKPEFLWLADAKTDRFKHTILTELGRVDEDEEIRDLAMELCERKLKTAAAIALIRTRRGVLKPATQQGITDSLRVSINRWRAANPSATWAQVQEALQMVSVAVEDRLKRQQAAAASASGSMPQ